MPREDHWLDASLAAAMAQSCSDLPTPTARLLLNLCGAVRSLERQVNDQAAEIQRLRFRLALHGINTSESCEPLQLLTDSDQAEGIEAAG